jgi:predicted DNA repair protein MutK
MAGTSLLKLIDDIATILDDVAAMTKVATKKTAGVLGDDLALNAQQVTGVEPTRELPVVWAVAKGSAVNKLILVPAALAISTFAPSAITPLLMFGGAFLCFEGCEKLAHKFLHAEEAEAEHAQRTAALADPKTDVLALEKEKVKGAIRTDFILSAEIIVIALGSAAGASFGKQLGMLVGVSVVMTVGVYGLVAGIVKIDDAGMHLMRAEGPGAGSKRALGKAMLVGAPILMKFLSVAGTAAMFMVGGGILVHGVGALHHWSADLEAKANAVSAALGFFVPSIFGAAVGLVAGAIALVLVEVVKKVVKKPAAAKADGAASSAKAKPADDAEG